MATAKPSNQEKNSFLFIHATDGQEWSTFMMKLLEAQPFNIPCHSVSYQDVNEKLIQKCSVLVLVFTPEMESRISSLNFDLLQPDSMHSCLVECNGHVNETDMPTWKTKFTQLPTVESYRAVLSGLIDLYELVTGNVEYFDADIDDVFIIDVKPTILYPGQKEVYVIFNYHEQGEVSVSVSGEDDRLSTRKYTKTIYVFDMPETCIGQKNVNIFVGEQEDPSCSTSIVILNSELLTEALTLNLQRILRSSFHEDSPAEGSYLDPFSKIHCSDEILRKFWLNLKKLMMDHEHQSSTFPTKDETQRTPEVNEEEVVTKNVGVKKRSKKKRIVSFFKKIFLNNSDTLQVKMKMRHSRRNILAKTQKINAFPNFPLKK